MPILLTVCNSIFLFFRFNLLRSKPLNGTEMERNFSSSRVIKRTETESDQLVHETMNRFRGQKKFNYVLGPI